MVAIRSPGDTEARAATEDIGVLDNNGPSFSGTAALWIEGPAGPCVFTAQVAG